MAVVVELNRSSILEIGDGDDSPTPPPPPLDVDTKWIGGVRFRRCLELLVESMVRVQFQLQIPIHRMPKRWLLIVDIVSRRRRLL